MSLLDEIEQYANQYNIPIMEKEGITFLCSFIKQHNIKNILEIGAAIGYSSICMANVDEQIHITTIERDIERYALATKYIKRTKKEAQINLIYGDALEIMIEGQYDLIFIDAAKAQYIKFFEKYTPYLNNDGYVISDNLGFHGLVDHKEHITSRNVRQLVRKIESYVTYLKENKNYDTVFYNIGDQIAVSKKK